MSIFIQNAFDETQKKELETLYKPYYYKGYIMDITGDACIGDEIVYAEPVYNESILSHFTITEGRIIYDSYSLENDRKHIFTIITHYGTMVRYASTVYRYLTLSRVRNLDERQVQLDEKHNRGSHKKEILNKRDLSNKGSRYDTSNLHNQIKMSIFTQ